MVLHEDPHHTFRLADDRVIPRFHLDGVEAGRRVAVYRIDPDSGERLGLLATARVGDGGWVDLAEPLWVRAGDAFVAVPGPPGPATPGHGRPARRSRCLKWWGGSPSASCRPARRSRRGRRRETCSASPGRATNCL